MMISVQRGEQNVKQSVHWEEGILREKIGVREGRVPLPHWANFHSRREHTEPEGAPRREPGAVGSAPTAPEVVSEPGSWCFRLPIRLRKWEPCSVLSGLSIHKILTIEPAPAPEMLPQWHRAVYFALLIRIGTKLSKRLRNVNLSRFEPFGRIGNCCNFPPVSLRALSRAPWGKFAPSECFRLCALPLLGDPPWCSVVSIRRSGGEHHDPPERN